MNGRGSREGLPLSLRISEKLHEFEEGSPAVAAKHKRRASQLLTEQQQKLMAKNLESDPSLPSLDQAGKPPKKDSEAHSDPAAAEQA